MCVNINKACNVLCCQSLCEIVVGSCCRELRSKSSCICFCKLPLSLSIIRHLIDLLELGTFIYI